MWRFVLRLLSQRLIENLSVPERLPDDRGPLDRRDVGSHEGDGGHEQSQNTLMSTARVLGQFNDVAADELAQRARGGAATISTLGLLLLLAVRPQARDTVPSKPNNRPSLSLHSLSGRKVPDTSLQGQVATTTLRVWGFNVHC